MNNVLNTIISKQVILSNRNSEDVVKVSTEYLSAGGDTFTVETRAFSPSVLETEQSINELNPEVSVVYPYKAVTPTDPDGAVVIQSPGINTFVTASQNYYTPVYAEVYKPIVLRAIDREFNELTVTEIVGESDILGE